MARQLPEQQNIPKIFLQTLQNAQVYLEPGMSAVINVMTEQNDLERHVQTAIGQWAAALPAGGYVIPFPTRDGITELLRNDFDPSKAVTVCFGPKEARKILYLPVQFNGGIPAIAVGNPITLRMAEIELSAMGYRTHRETNPVAEFLGPMAEAYSAMLVALPNGRQK